MSAFTAILNNLADLSIQAARLEVLQPSQEPGDINDLGRFLSC